MRLRWLSLVALSVAFTAQPVAAAWTPHPGPPPPGGREIIAAAPALPSPTSVGGRYVVPSAPRIVDVRKIARRAPTLPSPASWGGKFAATTLQSPARGGMYASTSGPHAVEAATLFAGLSLAQNEQLYGQDQSVEPADAQIAASPSALVEIAGNTMGVFGSDGTLQWTVDIQALFQLPAGYFFYAPSLQYDWGSGRWFLGGIASNTTAHNSWLLMAVSRTGDPFGTWSLIITDARINNPSQCPCPNTVYFMRESIAVVGDKVVQTEQAQNCLSGCSNVAGTILVMRKDHLVAGVQPAVDRFFFGYNQADFLAVQPQSVGGTYGDIAFVVWLKPGDSVTNLVPDRLGLLQITGLPYPDRIYSYQGTTTVWEKDFSAVRPTPAFSVAQPGGSLSPSPTPMTSAIYRDGQVVLAMNDGCGQVNCVRIIKMTNFGNATPVANSKFGLLQNTVPAPIPTDLDSPLGLPGANLFDGSLAIDPYGNLFVTAAFSSSTLNPGMAVAGISAPISSTSTVVPTSRIAQGPSSYSCSSASNNPWGAYMRSVPDPNNYSRVWIPGEAAVGSCWVTAIASATMGASPQSVGMSPTFGSTKGGQVVEVDGSFFVPNADQVLFGSSPGTILAESPTAILVSAPPGVAGTVTVTVQTPDGTATAGTFTYVTPGQLSGPPASSGVFHTR